MSRCDFKIVLLGSEHVGKTSLVIRFVNCQFNTGTPYQNTIGAAFCAKTMQSDDRDFNIGIWDTAGSERYEAMTRMYYRGAHAAIICYEPSSLPSWQRLRHWLMELRQVEEDCKVYLCGTKKDLLDSGAASREVSEDTVWTYSQGLHGHFLTSSRTGENVDELFQKILDDCVADQRLMKSIEEQRLQLIKDEVAYKAKTKEFYTSISSVTVALGKSPLCVRNKGSLKVIMLRLKCRCLYLQGYLHLNSLSNVFGDKAGDIE